MACEIRAKTKIKGLSFPGNLIIETQTNILTNNENATPSCT